MPAHGGSSTDEQRWWIAAVIPVVLGIRIVGAAWWVRVLVLCILALLFLYVLVTGKASKRVSSKGDFCAPATGSLIVSLVRGVNGDVLGTLHFDADCTVASIRKKAKSLLDPADSRFHLVFKGRVLPDDESMAKAGISSDSTLAVIVSSHFKMLTSSRDGTVRSWCGSSGQCTETTKIGCKFKFSNCFVPKDALNMIWAESEEESEDGVASLNWGTRDSKTCLLTLSSSFLKPAALVTDGVLLAAAFDMGTALVWTLDTGDLVCRISSDIGFAGSPVFASESGALAIVTESGMVRIWALEDNGEVLLREHTCEIGDPKRVTSGSPSIAFTPHAEQLAIARWSEVSIWDVASRKRLAQIDCGASILHSVVFSPCGSFIAAGTTSGSAEAWRWRDDSIRSASTTFSGHSAGVSVCYSPDGSCILTVGGTCAKLWDAISGKCLLTLSSDDEVMEAAVFAE